MLKDRLMNGAATFRPVFAANDDGAADQGGEESGGAAAGVAADQGGGDGAAAEKGDDKGAAAAGDAAAGDGEAADGGQQPARTDWKDRQIDRQHRVIQDEKRARAQLEAELDSARALLARSGSQPAAGAEPAAGAAAAAPAAARSVPQPGAPEFQQAVQIEVEKRNFEQATTDVDRAGRERYKDWGPITDTLTRLGGFDLPTMQSILAADDPAKVFHALGSQPDEYQRVMDLPPAKRLAEIVKIGMQSKSGTAPKRPSGAPAATEPIRTRNVGDPNALSDELTDDEWYARRERQKKARFAARQGQAR